MDLQERVRLKKADRSELYTQTPPFPTTNFLLELSNASNHACLFRNRRQGCRCYPALRAG